MAKIKLSTLIDGAFIFFSSFFVFYALLKTPLQKIFLTTFVSLLISFIITFLFILYLNNKNSKNDLLKQDEETLFAFKKYLLLSPNETILSLVNDYYKIEFNQTKIHNDFIFINEINSFVTFDFLSKKIELSSVLLAFKKIDKNSKLIFISNEFSSDVSAFILDNSLPIELVTLKDFFARLKTKDLLPPLEITKTKKPQLKTIVFNALKRENSKKFLILGGVLLLFSTLTYYKAFYTIIGILFVFISLYLRFFINEPKNS